MKTFFIFCAFLLIVGAGVAYKVFARPAGTTNYNIGKDDKILIAFYSYSGNTQKVAQAIHDNIGGDLFEIKTEDNYPKNYNEMVEQAKKEIQSGFRPELTTKIDNIAQYDVIFLGSPNWWGTITPQVSSFLQNYDLSGKKIIPFITNGGGGVQNTVTDLTAQCKGCNVSTNPWVGYNAKVFGIDDWLDELK